MSKLHSARLKCNPQIQLANDGGCLTNDAGMVLFIEFLHQLHFERLIDDSLHFNDQRSHFVTAYPEMFLQKILQNVAGYLHDVTANNWRCNPAIQAALGYHRLVSQPSMSRFFGVFSEHNLDELRQLLWRVAQMDFNDQHQRQMILDPGLFMK